MTAFFKTKLVFLLTILLVSQAMGQGTEFTQETKLPGSAINTVWYLDLPTAFVLPKKVNKGIFKVKMDFGDTYTLGEVGSPYGYEGKVQFTLQAQDNYNNDVPGVFNTLPYEIKLTNKNPEGAFVKDITSYSDALGNFPFTRLKITLNAVAFTDPSTSAAILSYIRSKLEIKLSYAIDYGFGISSATAPKAVATSDTIKATRDVLFSWTTNGQEFSNYQFQLLRLFNNSQATISSEKVITAEVDWSKALTIETQSAAKSLRLTIAEGQGYYLWRVRPIGSYYEGGISNPRNLSNNLWSTSPVNGTIITTPINGYPYFFFYDPDDNKNRIYSRVFTEGNKVSETTTYATGLQQVKQTQTYLPSKDTTLVTQTVLDKSGRPALTTIPVPLENKQKGYVEGLMQTNGELYKAENYDADGNYKNPSKVDNGTEFKYYSNSNPNTSVPDAEGYPYTRTLYYNDGTGRVKEQGGVGKKNMIGNGSSSSTLSEGKSVKTLYGTPSEEELIRLFGDEAPDHETVLKTITIDQNNTASVTLTSKEGNVIATSLSFQDNDNNNIFLPLEGETSQTVTNVDDKITKNTSEPYGFVSSKRLALLNATPIQIGYRVKCDSLQLPCHNANTECDYHLQIILHDLDRDTSEIVIDKYLKDIPCSPVDSMPGLYKTVVPTVTRNLLPGSYIIEKILKPGNIDVKVTAASDRIDKQVNPITGLITGWLSNVKCERQLDSFFVKLRGLEVDINAGTIDDYGFSNQFLAFFDSNATRYSMVVSPSTGTPYEVTINSPCCEIKVPVKWTPPFRCVDVPILVDKNGNGKLDVVPYSQDGNPADMSEPTEFFPDFEGYARSFLGNCYNASSFYGTYMEGWPEGTFNLMVYHMLTDKYQCGNTYPGKKKEAIQDSVLNAKGNVYNECGDSIGTYTANGVTMGCNSDGCPQYVCEDLFNCWVSTLSAYKAMNCMNIGLDDQSPYGVSNGYDGESSDHDQNFDDNMGGGFFLIRWIAKSKVSKRMRDLQASGGNNSIKPEYKMHLVQDFLKCTGYKFAKVLTQYDPEPLPQDKSSNVDYEVPAQKYSFTSITDQNKGKKSNLDHYYQPFKDWTPGATGGANPNTIASRGYFPFIKNPIYAFKYFEYPYEADDNYQDLEALTCYSDPNDCYKDYDGVNPPVKIPCCAIIRTDGTYDLSQCYFDPAYPNITGMSLDPDPAKPTEGIVMRNGVKGKLVVENFCDGGRLQCLYTKEYWSCGERNAFYEALKSYQVPDPSYYATFERDCDFMKQEHTWYKNLDSDLNGYPDIVSTEEKAYLLSGGRNWAFDPTPVQLLGLSGMKSSISLIENGMAEMKQGCLSGCEKRRGEIAKMLKDTLLSKCYIIGGCKTNMTDNIIPEEDFQAMVDELVKACKSQCSITTFTCEPTQECRRLKTKKTELGNNTAVTPVLFGSGGGSVNGSPDQCTPVAGKPYKDCGTDPDGKTSFCEYTKYKQATEWMMEIEISSKCTSNPAPKFTCSPGQDTCVDKSLYEIKPGESTKSVVTGAIPVHVNVNE